jgi:PIN domain nuclease of toxin-antitoxin system
LDSLAVLDASALMALIRGEPGADVVVSCLSCAIVSAVNQAEVQTKLVSAGIDESLAWWHIAELRCPSVPFDEDLARIAGGLVRVTRPYGLSLGDRACLALALQRKAAVYTTDAAWKNLNLGIEVQVIR